MKIAAKTQSKTISWKPGAPAVAIRGKWRRQPGGEILAEYDPDELQACLNVAAALDLAQDAKKIFNSAIAKQTGNS
jgi:hypothetical protein